MKYTNPIIPGTYPDPSVCRWGDTYYMVHSTFHYFPGVTLFESKDLINWTQIGHVLTRDSQLPLANAKKSEGIFAPTIRCNNGRFYMVTTNVSAGGNFYVWTDDIHGEWSEPIYVEQGGIDPSLYFENGVCYFMSNGNDETGRSAILQCEIDVETGKKLTETRPIWNGCGGRFLESPHLYYLRGQYYIMAAEGGTEYGHMVVLAKGSTPYGPFESAPNNPILTNRNLGGYPIQAVGHGDLVEDLQGNLWMVHLAIRQIGMYSQYHLTGRETYLVPVEVDENGWLWPGENGTTRAEVETEHLPEDLVQNKVREVTFANTKPEMEWVYLRNYRRENYAYYDNAVELLGTAESICTPVGTPTMMLIRQCGMEGTVSCTVSVPEGTAGLSVYMDHEHHYDVLVRKTEDGAFIEKRICIGDICYAQESVAVADEDVITAHLVICFNPWNYSFMAECHGKMYDLHGNQSKYISKEVAEGFTGVMFGLFAEGNGGDCEEPALFTGYACEYQD